MLNAVDVIMSVSLVHCRSELHNARIYTMSTLKSKPKKIIVIVLLEYEYLEFHYLRSNRWLVCVRYSKNPNRCFSSIQSSVKVLLSPRAAYNYEHNDILF
uniref:Uncharacterized protein n=1 Tax=Sipha flava TaxID=143950 RepID=A0A2S2QI32_9HEMI